MPLVDVPLVEVSAGIMSCRMASFALVAPELFAALPVDDVCDCVVPVVPLEAGAAPDCAVPPVVGAAVVDGVADVDPDCVVAPVVGAGVADDAVEGDGEGDAEDEYCGCWGGCGGGGIWLAYP